MSGIDLHMLAIIFAGFGMAELAVGVWQLQSNDSARSPAYILIGGGIGFLLASPFFYWAWDYYQSLITGIVIAAVGCNLGAFRTVQVMKAKSGDQVQ